MPGRPRTLLARRLSLAAFAMLALAVGGCEDEVDPTLGLDIPFSLYGYLDPTADQQAIRVVPIELRLNAASDTIDAAVTSTDLETGQTVAWRDSLVAFDDGTTGHVFVADATPRPGSTVRIDARRSDGAVSSVTVGVPPLLEPTVGAPTFVANGIGYPVQIAGAPNVLNGRFYVTVAGHPDDPPGVPRRLEVDLRTEPQQESAGLWSFEVPFVSAVRDYLADNGLAGVPLGLVHAEYSFFVTSPGWTPPTTDPDALVEPGTFSNVESGLGFVGSGYLTTVRWMVGPDAAAAAGFTTADDPASELVINEIQVGPQAWVEFYNPSVSPVALRGYSLTDDPSDIRKQGLVTESVSAGGFLAIPLSFPLDDSQGRVQLGLYGRAQDLVTSISPDPLVPPEPGVVYSYGSYPDGLSKVVRRTVGQEERIYDLFKGPLEPTPGAPNDLGLDLAFVNEVYTEGANGWVETVRVDSRVDSLRVLYQEDFPGAGFLIASRVQGGAVGLGVASEDGRGLVLDQGGGAVFLLAYYRDTRVRPESRPTPPPPPLDVQIQFRAVDYRPFGIQTAGRSEGYLPVGPGGTWTTGLRPTRGSPNTSARVGM